MRDYPTCAGCGIREDNRCSIEVRTVGGRLLCEWCWREAARGAVMRPDPEFGQQAKFVVQRVAR